MIGRAMSALSNFRKLHMDSLPFSRSVFSLLLEDQCKPLLVSPVDAMQPLQSNCSLEMVAALPHMASVGWFHCRWLPDFPSAMVS